VNRSSVGITVETPPRTERRYGLFPQDIEAQLVRCAATLLVAARLELDAAAARPTPDCGDVHRSLDRTMCCGDEGFTAPLWSQWAAIAFASMAMVSHDPRSYSPMAQELCPWVGPPTPRKNVREKFRAQRAGGATCP